MLIDWFTILAQVINFLILVWLLKRFLYKPILKAIDERESLIAKELADADAKKTEAQTERDEFQHKNEVFYQQRAALLSKATDEAKAERKRLLEDARQAADALSTKRQEMLRNDAHNLNQAISRRTQQEVFAIARKALTDLAGTRLEERLADVFIQRLLAMDSQVKAGLAEALKAASDPALVRSAYELASEQRAMIQNALNETFLADIHVRFETAPELISGIELTANGHKVAWSISDYLVSLKKSVDELLKENDKAEAQAQAQAKIPSALTQQIGKRAYELYEEQGRNTGHAVEDWERAEREIRKASLDPVKTEPQPEDKAKPKTEVKSEEKAEPAIEAEAKSEKKVKPKPTVKVGSESAFKAESRTEIKPEEPKSEAKTQ
jgi:F-type H+-transporting ATPase subunit b